MTTSTARILAALCASPEPLLAYDLGRAAGFGPRQVWPLLEEMEREGKIARDLEDAWVGLWWVATERGRAEVGRGVPEGATALQNNVTPTV
jgi:DNA-binding IclR family transcriptional regulator